VAHGLHDGAAGGLVSQKTCPRCGSQVLAVHRRWYDRIASLFVPLRRYTCDEDACEFSFVRVRRDWTGAPQVGRAGVWLIGIVLAAAVALGVVWMNNGAPQSPNAVQAEAPPN
jgi:ribosomal protein S27AE